MKKILFILLFAFGLASAQQAVINRPYVWGWTHIINSQTLADSVVSNAFTIKKINGNSTLWFKIGTVDSIKSDVSVKLKLYNSETNGWGYYQASNSAIFTISSSNITANNEFYYKLTDYNAWAWADSAKIVVSVTSTSSFGLDVYDGGQ